MNKFLVRGNKVVNNKFFMGVLLLAFATSSFGESENISNTKYSSISNALKKVVDENYKDYSKDYIGAYYKDIKYLSSTKKPNIILLTNPDKKEIDNVLNDLGNDRKVIIGNTSFVYVSLSNETLQKLVILKKATDAIVIRYLTDSTISYRSDTKTSQIINLANSESFYNYEIAYFAEDKTHVPNEIGLKFSQLTQNDKNKYQTNSGVIIFSVLNNSKAFDADILIGDVITYINDKKIRNATDFTILKDEALKYKNTIDLRVKREVNGEIKELTIPIKF